jgi:SAM-dependent methyltransferase
MIPEEVQIEQGARDRHWLVEEIRKRAPWYQRIAFPEYGITTTDDPAWMYPDSAWDNLFPGMTPEEAPRMRPLPKFERCRHLLPDFAGKSVLDVGTSCGFFAFEFCKRGASRTTGLDISAENIEKAKFCAEILGLPQAQFEVRDIGLYNEPHDIVWGASLHEHFFFPFYYFARMLCLAREQLVLETHHYVRDDDARVCTLDLAQNVPVTGGAHGFHFSRTLFRDYLRMLGISPASVEERVFYDDSAVRRLLLCVDTKEFQQNRKNHFYLRLFDDIR